MRKQWLLIVVEVNGERATVTELKFSWLSITLCLCESGTLVCEARVWKWCWMLT